MSPRWFLLASAALVCALIAATLLPARHQDIAILDRLAPRIERAQTLAPETRAAIMQLVDRARASNGDARYDAHRTVTVQRVTNAIKARGGSPELSGSVGQRAPSK